MHVRCLQRADVSDGTDAVQWDLCRPANEQSELWKLRHAMRLVAVVPDRAVQVNDWRFSAGVRAALNA